MPTLALVDPLMSRPKKRLLSTLVDDIDVILGVIMIAVVVAALVWAAFWVIAR